MTQFSFKTFKASAALSLALGAAAANAATTADLRSQQWALDEMNVDQAHQIATGNGVVVAVIDSGLDLTHPDFAGKIVAPVSYVCPAGGPKPCFGNHVDDRNGHGTHVAGTIVSPADGKGTTGVAPDAKIMPIRVLDAEGSGATSDIVAGIDWAVAHGADVINLSLGAAYGLGIIISNPVLSLDAGFADAITRAADAGVLVAVAAGNDSLPFCGGGELYNNGGLCVAAHGPGSTPAYYSDWGLGIDVVAPGGASLLGCASDILAAWPEDIAGYCGYNGYNAIAGTSMASPQVAGIAALLAELGVKGQDARARILATSSSFPLTLFGGLTGPFVNAYDAVNGL